jgi:hypothetical protein
VSEIEKSAAVYESWSRFIQDLNLQADEKAQAITDDARWRYLNDPVFGARVKLIVSIIRRGMDEGSFVEDRDPITIGAAVSLHLADLHAETSR